MVTLEAELKSTSEELRSTQIKTSAITEYFQQKELDLHSKLEAREQTRKQFESYVNEAVDKDRAREMEREQEKKELEKLRAQMKEIEVSYINQAKSHEKRAEESAVSVCEISFSLLRVLISLLFKRFLPFFVIENCFFPPFFSPNCIGQNRT